jgi:hypothetical protein
MDYKYIVIFEPDTDDKSPTENYIASHAEFYKSLRDIGTNFGIDHTTISKRLSKNSSTFLTKKKIWIIKIINQLQSTELTSSIDSISSINLNEDTKPIANTTSSVNSTILP